MAEYAPPVLQNFRPMYQPGTVDSTLTGPLEIMHRKRQEGLAEQHAQEHERQGRESLGLQGRQVATSERRADRYADMTNRQENRREAQAQFERSKLADAQHEALLHDLYAATTSNDPRAIQYAIDALHRAGYQTEQMEHVADPPVSPSATGSELSQFDPTLGGTIQSEFSSMAAPPGEENKPPLPGQTTLRDKQTSRELDAIEQKYMSGLQKKPSAADAQTSAELDAVEQKYLPALQGDSPVQPARKRFLPGQQIILGAGDSYNKLK